MNGEWSGEQLADLADIFANLYQDKDESRVVAAAAGLKVTRIRFKDQPYTNWFNILEYASPRGGVEKLIANAREENPEHDGLKRAEAGAPPPTLSAPDLGSWRGPETGRQLEKIIGPTNTLVHIRYLALGLERAKSVVRVVRVDGSAGSGFVIKNNILITNNHVLPDEVSARDATVQFNYQKNIDGMDSPIEEFKLQPGALFRTSTDDDWTAVQIDGDPAAKWGALDLSNTVVKRGDHVNIIQHPGGGPKQVSMTANRVVYQGEGRVQYLTDTLPGSSGSPVFDRDWNVVALHHSGGWIAEPQAIKKTTFYRNEGTSIDRIIAGLE